MEPKPILFDRIIAFDHKSLILLGLILVGVLISYMFSVSQDFKGTKIALKSLIPKASEQAINRIDLFLVLTFGPLIAAILLNPSTPVEAITAGVGWVGALNTVSGANK